MLPASRERRLAVAGAICSIVVALTILGIAWVNEVHVTQIETEYDAGVVHVGEVVSHDFVVKTSGRRRVVLDTPVPYCGCTSAELLPPTRGDGDVKVRVRVDTAFLGNRPIDEPTIMREFVEIGTSDRSRGPLVFAIRFIPKRDFGLSTQSVDFGSVARNTTVTRTVTVEELSDDRVITASSTDESWRVAMTRQGAQGNRVSLILVHRATRNGRHSGSVVIRTSSRYLPELRVFMTSTVG